MGICNNLSKELDEILNKWAKVRITDKHLKQLIQLAMVPNKEVLKNLQSGKDNELSTYFKNVCNNVYDYSVSNSTQQLESTKGTLFGAYNGITGYFQNVRNYKNDEAKLKSILFGGTSQLRVQSAFNLCNDYCKDKDFLLN